MGTSYNPAIVTDGLVLCLDAANNRSYPGAGTTWTDLKGVHNCDLQNGPAFSSANGGSIAFDGTDDVADVASPPSITGDSATLALWCKSHDSASWRSPGGYVTSGFDDYRLTFRRKILEACKHMLTILVAVDSQRAYMLLAILSFKAGITTWLWQAGALSISILTSRL